MLTILEFMRVKKVNEDNRCALNKKMLPACKVPVFAIMRIWLP